LLQKSKTDGRHINTKWGAGQSGRKSQFHHRITKHTGKC
jgi:hypothetical protein